MPAFAPVIAEFNRKFHPDQIRDFARNAEAFAPGRRLDPGLVLDSGSAVHRTFSSYMDSLPDPIREAFRGIVYGALTADPPQQVTLAWAPAYDYELTVWPASCGVTVLIKGRYPADKLPAEAATADR